jgi:hypothetical protein
VVVIPDRQLYLGNALSEQLGDLAYQPILHALNSPIDTRSALYAWGIHPNATRRQQNLMWIAANDQFMPLAPVSKNEERVILADIFNRMTSLEGTPKDYFNAMLVSYIPNHSVNDIRFSWSQEWLRRDAEGTAHVRHYIVGQPVNVEFSDNGPEYTALDTDTMIDVTLRNNARHSMSSMRSDSLGDTGADQPTYIISLYGIDETLYKDQLISVLGQQTHADISGSQRLLLDASYSPFDQRVKFAMFYSAYQPMRLLAENAIVPNKV